MDYPERIKVPIGKGKYIVAERNKDHNYDKEIYLFVETNGAITQDIAMVRPSYRYKTDGQLDWSDKTVDVLVWADEKKEDFTDEFEVKVYEEEEEDG